MYPLPVFSFETIVHYHKQGIHVVICRVVVVVQSFSHVQLYATPWTAVCQASLSFTISQSFLRFMSIEWVILSNHLILCCPILLLASIFLNIWVFSNETALCLRWPKYWSFNFSNSLCNEWMNIQGWYPLGLTGLILQSKGLLRAFSSTTIQKH